MKETRKFGDLSEREQRLVKSRYADVNHTSPAMKDQHLSQGDKELIRQQASEKLHEQGWLYSQKEETKEAPRLIDVAVSILTLGIFGGGN